MIRAVNTPQLLPPFRPPSLMLFLGAFVRASALCPRVACNQDGWMDGSVNPSPPCALLLPVLRWLMFLPRTVRAGSSRAIYRRW